MSSNTSQNEIPMSKAESESETRSNIRRAPVSGRMATSDKTSPRKKFTPPSRNRDRSGSSSGEEIPRTPTVRKPTRLSTTPEPEEKKTKTPVRRRSPSTSPEPVKKETAKTPVRRTIRSPSTSPEPAPAKTPTRRLIRSPSTSPEPEKKEPTKTKTTAARSTKSRRYSPSPEPPARNRREVSPSPERSVTIKTKSTPSFASVASGAVKINVEPLKENQDEDYEQPDISDLNLDLETPLEEGEVYERKTSEPGRASESLLSIINRMKPPAPTKPYYKSTNDGSVTYILIRITCAENLSLIKTWLNNISDSLLGLDGNESGEDYVDPQYRQALGDMPPLGWLRVVHNRINKEQRDEKNRGCHEDNYDQYRESNISLAAFHPEFWNIFKGTKYTNRDEFEKTYIYMEEHRIRDTERPITTGENPSVPELFCCFKDRKFLSVEKSVEQMYLKMQKMEDCGFVKHSEYTIRNPTNSRDFDSEPKLFCLITFADTVPEINRIYIKTCLDQSKFRGEIDPSTITEDDPVGKHVPYMCIVPWARLQMVTAFDPKYKIIKSGNYRPVSREVINKTLRSGGRGKSVPPKNRN